jgi:AAA+ ATPase superfamily predicted ATPase
MPAVKNPFIYGRRVSGKSFFDRTKVKADIRNVLSGGSNVLLYGPRRYGKSSLVGEIISDMRAEGGICAELNMMDVASLEDFITKFARIVYRELSPVSGALNLIAGFLRQLSP